MNSLADTLLFQAVPRLAHGYLRLLGGTVRMRRMGAEPLEAIRGQAGHYILAFWHSRFLMMPYAYPDRRIVVMVSRHRDAEMLVRTLRGFGLDFARGSTTQGGVRALRAVLRKVGEGYDVGVAPDGPRGPRRRVQPGVITVARLSGLPVVPVAFSARPARRLRSWDRTVVPRPFGRGVFVYGAPLRIARHAGPAEQEVKRLALEEELDRITDRADLESGLGPEEPRPPVAPA